MFSFYLKVVKTELITFCDSIIEIEFDVEGYSGKECFRRFDDGQYSKGNKIVTRHPNIVKAVITGKKGWGLWRKQWTEGIREGSFTKSEILDEFKKRNIEIPDSLMKEFYDFLYK